MIHVYESIEKDSTRKREIDALADAMEELKIVNSLLITRYEHDDINVAAGNIKVIPAWSFCYVSK